MTADDIRKHVELMVRSEDPLRRELAASLLYGALRRADDEIARLEELLTMYRDEFGHLPSTSPTADELAEIRGGQHGED